jgi:hypothetical protein
MSGFAPPKFPEFPIPPKASPVAPRETQEAKFPTTPRPENPANVQLFNEDLRAKREAAVEEAFIQSVEHVVHEYVRQDFLERSGEPTASSRPILEFHVAAPQHTLKVVLLLVGVFFGFIPMLNYISFTVFIAGCTAVYITDYLGYRHGSIITLLTSCVAFATILAITNLHGTLAGAGPFLFLLNVSGTLSVVAAIALVHYRWMQHTFPMLVCFLERYSVALGPVFALPSLFSTNVALLGSKHAPFGFTVCVCVLHYFFYSKLMSSFLFSKLKVRRPNEFPRPPANINGAPDPSRGPHSVTEDFIEEDELAPQILNGRSDSVTFTALTLLLPMLSYVSIQSNWTATNLHLHVVNVLATIGVPVIYLFWDPKHSLWFLRAEKARSVTAKLDRDPLGCWSTILWMRNTVLFAGYLFVLHWGVYRLLHSRYQYLFVGVPPPFNGILLLCAAYCSSALVMLVHRQLTADAAGETPKFGKEKVAVLLLSIIVSLMIAAAAGMPQFFYPMSALTASTFNAFILDRRNTSNFTMFVCCSTLLLLWWMYRTFSFIVMELHVLGDSAAIPTCAGRVRAVVLSAGLHRLWPVLR